MDEATINLRKKEIRDEISKFKNLQILEIFAVSIKDKASVDELRNYLFTLRAKKRDEDGVFRYYIDRVLA